MEKIKMSSKNTFTDPRDGKVYKTCKIGTQTWMAENLAFKANSGCWAYDNDEGNVAKYGYLYDWATAMQVAPAGWHLPTDEEWQTLIDELGGSEVAEELQYRKFRALLGGYSYSGSFYYLSSYGYWWSSTEADATDAWLRLLGSSAATVNRHYRYGKAYGFSVRCLKD